ncbi:coiled-coil domain-containing protein 57 isoform X2 [Oryctolagus cuniculus]|uniref:coiled-coil domain-containing protein 57 isoform X2 n=1 Tax=Oryctolagus cuniculus TaxID=9986 RepID=UPI00387975D7
MATRRGWASPGAGVPAAAMVQLCSGSAMNELLSRKEEEWRALQAQRARLQEAAVQEAQGRLRRLQEDFLYNLQVLEERDSELERYDAAFAQARGREEARQAELSELKIEVAKLRQALTVEARQREELQRQHQLMQQEHRLELERVHSDKNGEIEHHREQYDTLKWKLEKKLEGLDGELALQRQELRLEFEAEMRKREQALRQQADDMGHVVLSHERKVKLLSKELEAMTEAGARAAECLQRAESASAALERELQARTWELRDLEAVKDARIKDLEDELHAVQLTRKKEEEVFKRKREELDRLARERDAVLGAVKGAHGEQLRGLEARMRELQAHCENLEVQLRRAEWAQADAARERDAAIDRLREDSAALKSAWDAQVAQLSKDVVSKDLQVQALREEDLRLKAQLAKAQQDTERYKQQLSLAVAREQSLERDQVQLGLDWQRRCEAVERDQIQRSEALIEGLTTARAQAAAKLQETERVLREREAVLRAVVLERDQALEALRTHGLPPGQEAQVLSRPLEEGVSGGLVSSEIQRLQEQNASLRNAVAQMRAEMEALGHQLLPSAQLGATSETEQPDPEAGEAATPGYVLALEAEVQDLKHRLQTLEGQLEGVLEPSKVPASDSDTQPLVHTPAEAPGGCVHAGPGCAGLALRKLGDRARLLNVLVTRLRRKVLPKSLKLDTVQGELPREVDQVHLEVLELRKQVAELGRFLGTAQQEAVGPSGGKQPCTCSPGAFRREPGPQTPQALSVHRLQKKLKEAARKILSLRLEKEQLIEMGNRLRAELGHPKGRPPPHPPLPAPGTWPPREAPELPAAWGWPLGQVQPRLTAQRQHTVPAATCTAAQQKENRAPQRPQAQAAPEDRVCATQRSSSLASSPLQDTWKLLDLGSSPSSLTSLDGAAAAAPTRDCVTLRGAAGRSRECTRGRRLPSWPSFRLCRLDVKRSFPSSECPATESPRTAQTGLAIEGVTVTAQPKSAPARPCRAHLAKPRSRQPSPKIRNYNIKA